MNKIETILTNYPTIYKLINTEFTLLEICDILKSQKNITINYNTLKPIISAIKNNKIHPEYDKIVPLLISREDQSKIEQYSIKFNGIWICFKNSSYKKAWAITEKNLTEIPDPVTLLCVKRFLKLYHLPDEYLLDHYHKKYNMNLLPNEVEKINNISSVVKLEYDKIIGELKQKNLAFILGFNKNE